MEKYFELLIEQFKEAKGITKEVDTKSTSFISEFSGWINYINSISSNYRELLEYMKLYNYVDSDTVEIGKGKFDSIVKSYPTTIATPYSNGLKTMPNKSVITADFRVNDSKPVFVTANENGIKNFMPFVSNLYSTFMTQNPYKSVNIKNWEDLHNSNNYKIIVGMFGNRNDKDKTKKLNTLKSLRDKLQTGYKEEYAVINDSYCYVIASNRLSKKVKEYVKFVK